MATLRCKNCGGLLDVEQPWADTCSDQCASEAVLDGDQRPDPAPIVWDEEDDDGN